jgi:DNA adenine methylase
METRTCSICGGSYPTTKHNFEECYSLDSQWDMLVMDTEPSPCLKWVGGKTQILHHFKRILIDRTFDTYHEPFVGGGSMLLMVLQLMEYGRLGIRNVIASDINWQLISMYMSIRDQPYELMNQIDLIMIDVNLAEDIEYEKRHKCILTTLDQARTMGKKYMYYFLRQRFNELKSPSLEVSALFIILNKLCFRGLFRTGANGFNTPYGHYTNPRIYDRNNILKLSYLFNTHHVQFKHSSYTDLKILPGDIVYLDPPYYPIKDTSFQSYSEKKFDHNELVLFTKNINNFIQSNSWCAFVEEQYKQYNMKKIVCSRRINSKRPSDLDYEVIILSKSLHFK